MQHDRCRAARLLPGGLLALGATRLGEWLNKRTGARVVVIGGLVVFGGSLLLLAYGISRADDVVITTAITTASMAGALPQAAALETAMSTLPADYAVSGGAFVNAFRHLGGAFGAALAGSVAMTGYLAALPGTASQAARFSLAAESAGAHALGHGMSTAVTVAAATLLATALLALLLPGRDDAGAGAVGG